MKTKLVHPSDFETITAALRSGKVVAFPTDTVYGVGVVFDNSSAVAKMKVAKGRPETKPFPLMVANVSQMHKVAFLTERDEAIANNLTPGALTMVLNKKDTVSDEFTNGLSTIAIRIPDSEFVLKLLEEVGPMFVTSANISGQPACNTGKEVMESLNGRISLVVDGDAISHTASTIIDCTKEEVQILRQGDITIEDINRVITYSK